jgi:hypothetical protein
MRVIIETLVVGAAVAIVVAGAWFTQGRVHAANEQPNVTLEAEHIGPRVIEDLTRKSVARDYANAWSSMSEALSQNRADLLNAYFTGFAKDDLSKMVHDQKRTGIRIVYHDLGHHLDALFYSPAGDAMQLRDIARVEIEIMDGGKVLSREQANLQYMVLMTPGADRWLVRDLEGVPATKH